MKRVKKILKSNIKLVMGILFGILLAGSVAYATIAYQGTEVGYTNSRLSGVTTVQGALDELYGMLPDTPFKLGDYVIVVPDVSTYTIYKATTGYSSDQTITPSELQVWRVIDIHKDGSVDAVSEYVSSTPVCFIGTTGYANFVGALQTIAAQYAKAGYTIDTRMMGYGGQTMTIQTYSDAVSNNTYKTTTTYAFNGSINTAPTTTSTAAPTTGFGQEYLKGVGGDTLYLKDIQLVGNVYKSDTATYGSYGLIAYNSSWTATNYWLVSRLFYWFNASRFRFNGRYVNVNADGEIYSTYLREYNGNWTNNATGSFAVRPIITLKSGVTIQSGTGAPGSPYILN